MGLNVAKQVKKVGCNVLLVQKSILRDAVSELALHFLDKMKIMVIKDLRGRTSNSSAKLLIAVPLPAWTISYPNTWHQQISLNQYPLELPKLLKLLESKTLVKPYLSSSEEVTNWCWKKLHDPFMTLSALSAVWSRNVLSSLEVEPLKRNWLTS